MARNCILIEAKPVQICDHWLTNGEHLMTTLYYEIRGQIKYVSITHELLREYLEKYTYRLEDLKFQKTYHLHRRKS